MKIQQVANEQNREKKGDKSHDMIQIKRWRKTAAVAAEAHIEHFYLSLSLF